MPIFSATMSRASPIFCSGNIAGTDSGFRICRSHKIPFRTVVKQFSSREEAKNWIILNQIGRRNVTPEQRTYLMGKLYRETKKEQGAPIGNANAAKQMGNNFPVESTAEQIAEQFNVSDRTVKNAEKFADAVDTIADTYGDEARGAILSGVAKMTQKEVVDTARTLPALHPLLSIFMR